MSHSLLIHSSFISWKFAPRKSSINNNNNTRRRTKSSIIIRCSSDNPQNQQQQQQLNLSVLRFTLGIPGLDESYLPRWIGYSFGSLIILNHFLTPIPTPAQLTTEVVGLSLAAFSVVLPYLGQFLKGANRVVNATIPEGAEQIFAISPNIVDTIKEDLAWGSYTLLRNSNSISVLISVHDVLCVRGYWNTPKGIDFSKDKAVDWFKGQIQLTGLLNLTDTLYFPQRTDSKLWEMLPDGTRSLLVLPLLNSAVEDGNSTDKIAGFIVLWYFAVYREPCDSNSCGLPWINYLFTCLKDGSMLSDKIGRLAIHIQMFTPSTMVQAAERLYLPDWIQDKSTVGGLEPF